MMKSFFCLVTALLLALAMALPAGADGVIVINGDLAPMTQAGTLEMLSAAADAFYSDEALAEELQGEITLREERDVFDDGDTEVKTFGTLTHQGRTMRFLMDLIGKPDESGRYPLYITLHGGGESAPEANDSQWMDMYEYYRGAVKNGIYIACRGITDTWDLHFRPESYPLYDRLILAMTCLFRADPNRVYLLGFSAGGDGVYQIAPRMADRFAAVNMSSGHPNGVSLLNLANCPISIQVGVRDYYSEGAMRCVRGAEFDRVLDGYHTRLNYGYEHQVLVHVPEGHNYSDWDERDAEVLADPAAYADPAVTDRMLLSFREALVSTVGTDDMTELSYNYDPSPEGAFNLAVRRIVTEEFGLETRLADDSAVHYVSRYTRDPAPRAVVWDLGTRAALRETDSFYWLRADASVTQGTITASVGEDNTVTVSAENLNGDFSILVNPVLLDVSRPVRIVTDNGVFEVRVNPSEETLRSSMKKTGDPSLAWVAEIPFSLLH